MSTNVYDMFIALELEALNMYFVFQKKGNSFNELNLIESIMYKTYIFKNCWMGHE